MPPAVLWQVLLPVLVLVLCVGLFVLGFVRPARSRLAEEDVARTLTAVEWWTSRVTAVGGYLARPFRASRRMARKSARGGRNARAKADGDR